MCANIFHLYRPLRRSRRRYRRDQAVSELHPHPNSTYVTLFLSLPTRPTIGMAGLPCDEPGWALTQIVRYHQVPPMADKLHGTERNGRKTLTTVQGLPKKFDQKKILKVIKKKFGMTNPHPTPPRPTPPRLPPINPLNSPIAKDSTLTDAVTLACNGTIVNDTEMGEVIQLQGDQRKDVQEFLVDKKEGLELDAKTIKVEQTDRQHHSYPPPPRTCPTNRSLNTIPF